MRLYMQIKKTSRFEATVAFIRIIKKIPYFDYLSTSVTSAMKFDNLLFIS
uniref:Uncharacterized protein n=1 Tax=Lepeophtheirus salmonis TaxID=72036 RepID=A0A0K2VFL7_LEPSM